MGLLNPAGIDMQQKQLKELHSLISQMKTRRDVLQRSEAEVPATVVPPSAAATTVDVDMSAFMMD
jgi:hypothetical protein